MVIFCSFWVAMSLADTFTMPFASRSNVTSICGTPRGAGRHDLVRVHALVRLFAEQFLDDGLHARNARGAADEDDLVDLRRVDARIRQRLLGRADSLLEQVFDNLLELRARQLHGEVLG